MVDQLIYIPNDDTQNYPFCRLYEWVKHTQLNKPTNQNPLKVRKVVAPTSKLYWTSIRYFLVAQLLHNWKWSSVCLSATYKD